MWFAFFWAVNITGDIKKFVQTLNLLNETKIVEIWTKCFIVLSEGGARFIWEQKNPDLGTKRRVTLQANIFLR